jgi:hypothetical protein
MSVEGMAGHASVEKARELVHLALPSDSLMTQILTNLAHGLPLAHLSSRRSREPLQTYFGPWDAIEGRSCRHLGRRGMIPTSASS